MKAPASSRKVAATLGLPFTDSDHEIESVSRMTIPDLFDHAINGYFPVISQFLRNRQQERARPVDALG